MNKIPGFTPHGTRHRAHVLLDAPDALAVSDEAKRRRSTVGAVMRERIVRGGEAAGLEGGRVVWETVTADGRRVAVVEWAATTGENP